MLCAARSHQLPKKTRGFIGDAAAHRFEGPTRSSQPGARTKRPVVWTKAKDRGVFGISPMAKSFVTAI